MHFTSTGTFTILSLVDTLSSCLSPPPLRHFHSHTLHFNSISLSFSLSTSILSSSYNYLTLSHSYIDKPPPPPPHTHQAIMFSHRAATAALRASGPRGPIMATTKSTFLFPTIPPPPQVTHAAAAVAAVHTTTNRSQAFNKDKNQPAHAGSFARTDDSITVEYPQEHELPSSEPVSGAGRAGMHVYPTLATFSLEGKVGVVTGGARGLGLVMGQGMVVSGADLAIVDMNSECTLPEIMGNYESEQADKIHFAEEEAAVQAQAIMDQFKKDNPNAKK